MADLPQVPRGLEGVRLRMASVQAMPTLALLGFLIGILAGGLLVGFRFVLETVQRALLPGKDLARHVRDTDDEMVHLWEIPARRRDAAEVPLQATLQEALEHLQRAETDALWVKRPATRHMPAAMVGVVTRLDIEKKYKP